MVKEGAGDSFTLKLGHRRSDGSLLLMLSDVQIIITKSQLSQMVPAQCFFPPLPAGPGFPVQSSLVPQLLHPCGESDL